MKLSSPQLATALPVQTMTEAQRLFSDGKRVFAVSEMDEEFSEVKSLEMLAGYTSDQLVWMEASAPLIINGRTKDQFIDYLRHTRIHEADRSPLRAFGDDIRDALEFLTA